MRAPVVFEEIRPALLPLFLWYVVLGHAVTVVRQDGCFRSLADRYRSSGRVTFTDWNRIDHQRRHEIDGEAIRLLEERFDSWFRPSGLRSIIRSLYGTEDAEKALKKSIVFIVKSAVRFLLVVRLLQDGQPKGTATIVVPGQTFAHFRDPKEFFTGSGCTVPLYARCCHFISYHAKKVKNIALLSAYPLWLATRIGIPARMQEKTGYRTGIRVYDTDLSFFQKHRSIDFLVDGAAVTRKETVFIPETPVPAPYREALAARGYHVLDAKAALAAIHGGFLGQHLPGLLKNWALGLLFALTEPPAAIRSLVESLDTHIVWSAVLSRISLTHYVVYNDTSPAHVLRNIVLRQNGVTSWYYVHSCGTANYFSPAGDPEIPHVVFAYLDYDRFVTWNAKVQRYYEAHPLTVRKFEGFGCLWSQAIRELCAQCREPGRREGLIRTWRLGGLQGLPAGKVVAVFDSTFGGEATLTPSHIVKFIDGILKIPDRFPETLILFKMKYSARQMAALHPESSEPAVHQAYQRLRSHPRCILLDDDTSEAAEVIAASDLVISACFTSPTIEALGAGKKGMYFDADGKSQGTYYDRFPHLAAHDEGGLLDAAGYWLFTITDREFGEMNETLFRQEIDWFGDGKAVDRFRQALAGGPA